MPNWKRILYAALICAAFAVRSFAQTSATSNCNQFGQILTNGSNGTIYINTGQVKCTSWILSWYSSGSTQNFTFGLFNAPDSSVTPGSPGAFVLVNPANFTAGTNPVPVGTAVTPNGPSQGLLSFFSYAPYIQVQITGWVAGNLNFNLTGYADPVGATSWTSTVTQPIWTNQTFTASVPLVSGNLQNIGQNQHRAVIKWTGGSCSGSEAVDVYFQASYDNVTFFEIGSPVTSEVTDKNNNGFTVIEADGAFPYIQLNSTSITATCTQVNAWYTGSIRPNAAQSAFIPRYANRGMHFKSFQIASAGANNIVALLDSSRFICIYGIQIANSALTAQTVGITDSGTGVFMNLQFAAAADAPVIIGPSPIPVFCTNRGDTLQLTLTASTSVTGMVQWRYEDNPQ